MFKQHCYQASNGLLLKVLMEKEKELLYINILLLMPLAV